MPDERRVVEDVRVLLHERHFALRGGSAARSAAVRRLAGRLDFGPVEHDGRHPLRDTDL